MQGGEAKFKFNVLDSVMTSSLLICFTDSWGPAKTAAIGGYRYVRIFVARRSKFTFTYLMKLEKDLVQATVKFLMDYQSQFNTLPNVLFMDGAPGHHSE